MKYPRLRPYRFTILAGLVALTLSAGSLHRAFFAQAQTAPAAPSSGDSASAKAEIDAETQKPITTLPDGLKIIDEVVGTGVVPKGGDTVSVKYVGKLMDGTVFDASDRHGSLFTYQHQVTALIRGWTEGVSTMHQGGKRKLIIPPDLGYGFDGMGNVIPPNATLIFEIELVDVKPLAP